MDGSKITRACMLGHVQLFSNPMDLLQPCRAPLSMEFSRQEYWNRLPVPPPGDLPNPGIKPASPVSPALAGRFFTTEPPGKPSYKREAHLTPWNLYT